MLLVILDIQYLFEHLRKFATKLRMPSGAGAGAGAGAGSRNKIPEAGAAPKQTGSETLRAEEQMNS